MITDQQLSELKMAAEKANQNAMDISRVRVHPATILSLIERVESKRVTVGDQCKTTSGQEIIEPFESELFPDDRIQLAAAIDQALAAKQSAALEEAAKVAESFYSGYRSQLPVKIADKLRALKSVEMEGKG